MIRTASTIQLIVAALLLRLLPLRLDGSHLKSEKMIACWIERAAED